ncbi:hypothetical protein [Microbacterium testaceum]|nr:hypothetical protein [Microbacterium testaceum]
MTLTIHFSLVGGTMNVRTKLAAGLLTLGMIGGGMAIAPAASAATEMRENYTNYATKARCESVKSSTMNRLRSTGRQIQAHTPCQYQSGRQWMFQVWYI